jgi:hypothetical protein
MIELLQEHMDALVVAEHLIKIRQIAKDSINTSSVYYEASGIGIDDIYGLATEVLFSAERVVRRYNNAADNAQKV